MIGPFSTPTMASPPRCRGGGTRRKPYGLTRETRQRLLSGLTSAVTPSISESERMGDALPGVGWARSTDDDDD